MTQTLRRSRRLGCLFEVVETVVLTFVIFLGVQTFVAQPYQIQGTSMENSLLPRQYVLIDKLSPHWTPYARGDVVVFNPPSSVSGVNGTPFIKRVIGVPGDHVELRDGIVYVNGAVLREPYVYADTEPLMTNPAPGGPSDWLVPQGQLFVMGDHRNASEDSRLFGPIEIGAVIGRAWLRYWPIDAFGILQAPIYASDIR